MKHQLTNDMLESFQKALIEEEKSEATIDKYMRDVQAFYRYAEGKNGVDKALVVEYKKYLLERYSTSSVNSMLAAINRFFQWTNMYECAIKVCRIQKEAFRSREREMTKGEYHRLLQAAQKKEKERLYLLMQTIASTGIRISELRFVTVQAVQSGKAVVSLKGKTRTVLLPSKLRSQLRQYIKKKRIREGSVFITRSGKPMDRSNILHEMKALCEDAGVDQKKVFPHNLRHLFACTYYKVRKDISHLADLLGHSSINTTRIYTRISGEEQARQIDMLGLTI